jgi:PAS domain S-box-containing protein
MSPSDRKRILIVEDEVILAEDLQTRLSALGFAVAGLASTGEEAVAMSGLHKPDFVLMDIQLPGELDGIAAAMEIRRQREVPVVFLTAFGDEETMRRARPAEPYGFLLKPVVERDLRATLEMALARHESERRLQESEARLQRAVMAGRVGLWEWDLDSNQVYYSLEWKRQLGFAEEEISPDVEEWRSRLHPEDRDRAWRILQSCREEGVANYQAEFRLRHKDGSYRWILAQGLVEADPSGKPVRVVGSHIDFTSQKTHAAEIERLNRLYQALSQINREITQARSREELLGGICRVLVESGGMKMAWVGWCDPESMKLVPLVQHGDHADYSNQVKVYVDERPEGRGPAGRAVREGRTIVCNDFLRAAESGPWHEAASRSGFGAGAALPIREAGQVRGALMVYATEPGFYQQQEVLLLEEAAREVSFAIDHLMQDAARKQAEESLRQTHAELELYFSNALDLLCIADTRGYFRRLNPEWEKTLGYPLSEMINHRFQDLVHPDDLAGTLDAMSRLSGQRPVLGFTNRYRHQDGTYRWIEWRAFPQGELIYAVARDMTSHQQALAALEASDRRYRCLFESGNDAIFVHHIHADGTLGKIKEVNQIACEILGYSFEEFRQKTPFDLVATGYGIDVGPAIVELQNLGHAVFEQVLATRDGRRIPVELSARKFEIDGCSTIISFARDITERKRVEAALRESEARFRTLFESSPVSIWEEDFTAVRARLVQLGCTTGEAVRNLGKENIAELRNLAALVRVVDFNPQTVTFFGVRTREEVWTFLPNYFDDRSLALFNEELAALSEGHSQWSCEMPVRAMDGRDRLLWLCLRLADGAGRPWERVFVSFVDITERKRMEVELRQSKERYQTFIEQSHEAIYCTEFDQPIDTSLPVEAQIDAIYQGAYMGECNRAMAALYGLASEQEFRGRRLVDFHGGKDNDTNRQTFRTFIESRYRALGVETEEAAPGGRKQWFLSNNVGIVENGFLLRIWGTTIEVTERKLAETALRQSEQRFRDITFILADWVWEIDAQGRYSYCSESVRRLLGWDVAEILGRTPFDLMPPAEAERVGKIFGPIAARKEPFQDLENTILHRDGSLRYVLTSGVPLLGPEGSLLGYRGTDKDITDRKRAEDLLRKLSRAVEQSPVSIVITDPSGAIEYLNPKFTQVTGYTLAEARGQNPRLLKGNHTSAEEYRNLWETISKGGDWHGEFHNKKKDGTFFWELASISPIFNAEGQITHFLAIKEDITERRTAEIHLRESYHRLNAVLNTIPDPVWLKDLAGCFQSVNLAWLSFFGLRPEEVLGKTTAAFLPADVAARLAEEDRQVAASGQLLLQSECLVNQEGQKRWFETVKTPLRNSAGQVVGTVGIARDMPEHRLSEEALRNSEGRLRLALEAAKMGTWEWDLRSDRIYWPAATERMNGFEPGTFPGTVDAFLKLLHPDSLAAFAASQKKAREGDGSFQAEAHFRLPGRRERWGLVVGQLLRDAQGNPERMVGIDMDITERKRMEAQLRQSQKLEAIGQLAGGVAHDFNNILAAMMMNLGLLETDLKLNQEVMALVVELQAEARRAANLTQQLLLFSRRSMMDVKMLDLNEVVANLLKMLGRLIGEHIGLRFDRWDGLSSVQADSGMLDQVLMNLAVNARDAMPKGGRLTITTSETEVDEERAKDNPDARAGRFVCLTVEDTGCGMDEATLGRIFEPFFTTKEPGKGTGLGLSTVYGIVAQHKGWVEVVSTVGQGTTFRVYLPAAAGAALQKVSENANFVAMGGKETILVVEDAEGVRRVLTQTLRFLGYRILEAPNGPAALELWRQHSGQIDLLFSDMVMPEGLTGLDLADRLREQKPNLKVIISSGYSTEITVEGRPLENVVFLSKPYQIGSLAKTVREYLDQK